MNGSRRSATRWSDRTAIPRPSARSSAAPTDRLAWTAAAGSAVCALALAAYAAGPAIGRSSVFGVVVAAGAVALSVPVLGRIGRRFPDLEMAGIMRLALGVKLLATLPRFERFAELQEQAS